MTQLLTRRTFGLCALAAAAQPLHAAPRTYDIGPGGARISYTFRLSGAPVVGTIPIDRADLQVDAGDLSRSRADVTADVRRARTGLVFATEALQSASVLDANRHPRARFRSTRVVLGADGRISNGAALEGELTLRGVTRPVRLNASLFRPQGSAAGDLSRLSIVLRGRLDRRDFGATGYANLVEPNVDLEITADIRAL